VTLTNAEKQARYRAAVSKAVTAFVPKQSRSPSSANQQLHLTMSFLRLQSQHSNLSHLQTRIDRTP
jgi:hypothetical protein